MTPPHASQPMLLKEGYVVTINVREGDVWKICMSYWSLQIKAPATPRNLPLSILSAFGTTTRARHCARVEMPAQFKGLHLTQKAGGGGENLAQRPRGSRRD